MAQSVDAAVAAVGAGKPEFSGYLMIDVPEISLAGPVKATVRSELPGTLILILLRQYPQVPGLPAAAQSGLPPLSGKLSGRSAAAPPAPAPKTARPSVFVAAKRFEPGELPVLNASFEFQRNERITLLAFARGRWLATAREIKLARPVDLRP